MTILIAGATGLIGQEIVKQAHAVGIGVNYLTTSKVKITKAENYNGFYWNPAKGQIDSKAFDGVTAIINLAGATIANKWTASYKEAILESRIASANLIHSTLQTISHDVHQYISASGVSVYPNSKEKFYTEEDSLIDTSFLADVVVAWEKAADAFQELGIEVTKLRTGVVLARNAGALAQMIKPIKLGIGSPLGDGNQWISWIHIEDIAGMYLFVLKRQLEGTYNAVAPNAVTNKKITRSIAKVLNKPLWMPAIPAFVIKFILGEMSTLVLDGQRVSSEKIEQQGFTFKYPNIVSALEDLK